MELGSSNLSELDPFGEFSTPVGGDVLADQSLPDEEYLQPFTNERVDSDYSDWGKHCDGNASEYILN